MACLIATTSFAGSHETGMQDKGHKMGKEMMFENYDANKDGMVSQEEFMKKPAEMFKKIDKNQDGNISKDEHKSFADMKMEKHGKMMDDKMQKGDKMMHDKMEHGDKMKDGSSM